MIDVAAELTHLLPDIGFQLENCMVGRLEIVLVSKNLVAAGWNHGSPCPRMKAFETAVTKSDKDFFAVEITLLYDDATCDPPLVKASDKE